MLSKAILARFGNTKVCYQTQNLRNLGILKYVLKGNIRKIWEDQSCYQKQNFKTWEYQSMLLKAIFTRGRNTKVFYQRLNSQDLGIPNYGIKGDSCTI